MYKLNQFLPIVFFAALLIAVSGCESDATSQVDAKPFPNIGVVNVERLATALGRDRELKQQVQQEQQKLIALRDEFTEFITAEQESSTEAGTKEPTTEQQQVHAEKLRALKIQERQANERLTFAHMQIIKKLTADAGPYIQNVARDRSIYLVLKSGDHIIAAHQTINITDAVVAKMTAAGALGPEDSTSPDAFGLPPSTPTMPDASGTQQQVPATDNPQSGDNPADLFDFESFQDEPETSQP